MANWASFAKLAKNLVNSLGDTEVTISRVVSGYDRNPAASASWTGMGVFNWEKSVVKDGYFTKASTLTIPLPDSYVPQIGDTVTANGKKWAVKSIIEGGVGQPLYYELEIGK